MTSAFLIDTYDAAAGRLAALALETSLQAQVAATRPTPAALHAARRRVPSAKPSRMPGMRSKSTRAETRSGKWERWTLDRILAVADGLGYEARIELVKKPRNPTG